MIYFFVCFKFDAFCEFVWVTGVFQKAKIKLLILAILPQQFLLAFILFMLGRDTFLTLLVCQQRLIFYPLAFQFVVISGARLFWIFDPFDTFAGFLYDGVGVFYHLFTLLDIIESFVEALSLAEVTKLQQILWLCKALKHLEVFVALFYLAQFDAEHALFLRHRVKVRLVSVQEFAKVNIEAIGLIRWRHVLLITFSDTLQIFAVQCLEYVLLHRYKIRNVVFQLAFGNFYLQTFWLRLRGIAV